MYLFLDVLLGSYFNSIHEGEAIGLNNKTPQMRERFRPAAGRLSLSGKSKTKKEHGKAKTCLA